MAYTVPVEVTVTPHGVAFAKVVATVAAYLPRRPRHALLRWAIERITFDVYTGRFYAGTHRVEVDVFTIDEE